MTDDKRKAGFDRDSMRGQFDRFLKTAMDGLDELRETMLRASQTAKVKLDATFLRRERDRLFQHLGEQVYELIEDGRLKAVPALRDTLDRIHAVTEQLAEEEQQAEDWEAEEAGEAEAAAETEPEDEEEAAPEPPKRKAAPRKKKASKKVSDAKNSDDEEA